VNDTFTMMNTIQSVVIMVLIDTRGSYELICVIFI
jgi:hypothetical protein